MIKFITCFHCGEKKNCGTRKKKLIVLNTKEFEFDDRTEGEKATDKTGKKEFR